MAHNHKTHGQNGHGHGDGHAHNHATVKVKVLRQENQHAGSHWETFEVPREEGMNVTTILQRIAANPVTDDHHQTTPVAFDCNCLEEVCGACTMVINGRVRQACSALVENLVKDSPDGIELRPMTKFPVVRDLVVNRGRMFDALKKIKAWVQVDGYHYLGSGPRISPKEQEEIYPVSRCMTCGCCLDACPQYGEQSNFIGAFAIAQAVMFNEHPTAKVDADTRNEILAGRGGVVDCGNSQNCVKVCPKDIPLTTSIAKAGRDVTKYKIRKWLGR